MDVSNKLRWLSDIISHRGLEFLKLSKPSFLLDTSVLINYKNEVEIARDAIIRAYEIGKILIPIVALLEFYLPHQDRKRPECPSCEYRFKTIGISCPECNFQFSESVWVFTKQDRSREDIERDLKRIRSITKIYNADIVCVPEKAQRIVNEYIFPKFRQYIGSSIIDALIIASGIVFNSFIITNDMAWIRISENDDRYGLKGKILLQEDLVERF